MPQCLHGWGSDGINPSGCPQCDQLQRERDKEELTRLRERMRALLPLLEEGRRIASENYCGATLLDSALRCGMRKGHDDRTHHKASVDMLGVIVIEASNVVRGYTVDSRPESVAAVRERFGANRGDRLAEIDEDDVAKLERLTLEIEPVRERLKRKLAKNAAAWALVILRSRTRR